MIDKKPSFHYELSNFEPFQYEDGTIGVAIPYPNGCIEKKPITKWKEDDEKLGNVLEEKVQRIFWELPGEPILDDDGYHLLFEIERCLAERELPTIEFPDSKWPNALASWIQCTHVPEIFMKIPRLIISGPTETGKNRILDMISFLAYRGYTVLDPTSPMIYRMAELYRPTLSIDEFQDLPEEVRTKILVLYKGGFDGTKILRNNEALTDIEFFRTKIFMALAIKNYALPEDDQNRAIMITMRKNNRKVAPSPQDDDDKRGLRARLLAFRLRVLSGIVDVEPIFKQIDDIIENPIIYGDSEYTLDGRSKDIARTLLFPGVLCRDYEDTLGIILESRVKALQRLRETFEARVFFAYQRLKEKKDLDLLPIAIADHDRMWAHNVRIVLEDDLKKQGNYDEKKPLKTQRVTNALDTLSFKLKTGRGNRRYIDEDEEIYQSNLNKYGRRVGDEAL